MLAHTENTDFLPIRRVRAFGSEEIKIGKEKRKSDEAKHLTDQDD